MYPTAMTVSSLNTYSSWEIAVASKPLPRMAVPVLVIKFGCEGNLSTISAARSAGGGGFEDEEAIVRLHEGRRQSVSQCTKVRAKENSRREDLWECCMGSRARCCRHR